MFAPPGSVMSPRAPAAKRPRAVSSPPKSPHLGFPVVAVIPGLRYITTCGRCSAHIPHDCVASLCEHKGCRWIVCLACFPDTSKDLLCPSHTGDLRVRTALGRVLLPAPAVAVDVPVASSPMEASLLSVVATLLGSVPPSVQPNLNRTVRRFVDFLEALGRTWTTMQASDVMCYFVARCAPSEDIKGLPPEWPKPVLPSTASGDLSLLRRYAKMRGDSSALTVLTDDQLRLLVSAAGANCQRDKSAKNPVMMSNIETFVNVVPLAGRDAAHARDSVLLVVGILFGLRRSELVSLKVSDAVWAKKKLRLRIRRDKTNASALGTQHHRFVTSAHRLLDRLWPAYVSSVLSAMEPDDPLFPRLAADGSPTSAPLAPSSVSAAVRRAVGPGFSAHSLRVGCATELFRAGVPLALIKEIGRWASDTALLYVIPDADRMADAGRLMGPPPVVGPWTTAVAA
jgi:integrase